MENFIFCGVLVKTLGVDISWFVTLTHYVPVSSDINEVIRAVLNFFFFFFEKILLAQKVQEAQKRK